jgi:hypothetical protein
MGIGQGTRQVPGSYCQRRQPDPAEQETTMMEEWNKNRSLRPDRTELAPHTEDESAKRREREAKRKQKLDEQLDQGLEDTFPGSDPVAVTQPPHSARDKRRP